MAKWKHPSGLPMMVGLECSGGSADSPGRTGQKSLSLVVVVVVGDGAVPEGSGF